MQQGDRITEVDGETCRSPIYACFSLLCPSGFVMFLLPSLSALSRNSMFLSIFAFFASRSISGILLQLFVVSPSVFLLVCLVSLPLPLFPYTCIFLPCRSLCVYSSSPRVSLSPILFRSLSSYLFPPPLFPSPCVSPFLSRSYSRRFDLFKYHFLIGLI
ncbi:unnamed protein product, partial [Laminaria digitata]